MTQGPDNNRPEPYFSPLRPDRSDAGAPPAAGTSGPGSGPGGGPAPGFGRSQGAARPASGPASVQGAGSAANATGPAGTGAAGAGPTGPGAWAGPAAGAATGEADPADSGPADPGAQAAPGGLAELRAKLAEAETKAAASHEQFLRAVAETENVRRRSQEEIVKARKFANEAFAESLLPVIDSLELALKVESPSIESMREGVEATLRLMVSAFEKNQLVGIDPAGQKFDPNHHQAISMVPADATDPPTPANHVATVLQKGYLINDRVLRPALVTVVQG